MATLIQLIGNNQLFPVDPDLGRLVMPERFIYLMPRAKKWLEEELPGLLPTWQIEETPIEQVDALIGIFCSGQQLSVDKSLKHLRHKSDPGIWELKTGDVRIFGWFPQKDHFIASACFHADRVKQSNMYEGFITQAKRDRDLLDLDEPKYISGDNPHGVVSNPYFS